MVVINVIEYKNADAYDHLCVRFGVWTPAVFCIFVERIARNRVSCKWRRDGELNVFVVMISRNNSLATNKNEIPSKCILNSFFDFCVVPVSRH